MVVMQCIWCLESAFRFGVCVGWDRYIYIYSSGSSVHTEIKAHCMHRAKVPVFKKWPSDGDFNPHFEYLPLQVKLKWGISCISNFSTLIFVANLPFVCSLPLSSSGSSSTRFYKNLWRKAAFQCTINSGTFMKR